MDGPSCNHDQEITFGELTKIILAPKSTVSLLKPECFASPATSTGSFHVEDLPPQPAKSNKILTTKILNLIYST